MTTLALPFTIAVFLFIGIIGIFVKPVRIKMLQFIKYVNDIINRE